MTMLMRGILTYKSDVFVMMILMRGVLTDTSDDDDAHVWYFDWYKAIWLLQVMMMLILYTGTYASVLTDTKRFDWYNDDDAHTVHWDLWQTVS